MLISDTISRRRTEGSGGSGEQCQEQDTGLRLYVDRICATKVFNPARQLFTLLAGKGSARVGAQFHWFQSALNIYCCLPLKILLGSFLRYCIYSTKAFDV